MLELADAAERVGLKSIGAKLSFDKLINEAPLPAIIHWNQYHFVVLYKVSKKKFYVADPSAGLLTFTEEEFKSHVISDKMRGEEEGVALLLEPTSAFYENRDEAEERNVKGLKFKNIFNYILPYKKLVFQLFLGLGISSLLQCFCYQK